MIHLSFCMILKGEWSDSQRKAPREEDRPSPITIIMIAVTDAL